MGAMRHPAQPAGDFQLPFHRCRPAEGRLCPLCCAGVGRAEGIQQREPEEGMLVYVCGNGDGEQLVSTDVNIPVAFPWLTQGLLCAQGG